MKKYTRSVPRFSGKWWRKFALHSLLYAFMLAVSISGLFFSNSYKSQNVVLLGWTVPDLFPQSEAHVDLGREIHFWLSYVFFAFVILHGADQRKVVRSIWRRWLGAWQRLRLRPQVSEESSEN